MVEEARIGLGLSQNCWPAHQPALFKVPATSATRQHVNYARPIAREVDLASPLMSPICPGSDFLFGTSTQRIRRKAIKREDLEYSCQSTPSMSPSSSDSRSSVHFGSLPHTPDASHANWTSAAALAPTPTIRPVKLNRVATNNYRASILGDADFDSEDSDSEDFMEFLEACPRPTSEPLKDEPTTRSRFSAGLHKLTSPSLLSLSLGSSNKTAKVAESASTTPNSVYQNRRAMSTTPNLRHRLSGHFADVFVAPKPAVAGPSTMAELNELRASLNGLAVSARPSVRSMAPKRIRRKAVPALPVVPGSPPAPQRISPRTSSLPKPVGRRFSSMFTSGAARRLSFHSHTSDTSESDTATALGHKRQQSSWSSSSSSSDDSGFSSPAESSIRTPAGSAYDSPTSSSFSHQQLSSFPLGFGQKQYYLDVAERPLSFALATPVKKEKREQKKGFLLSRFKLRKEPKA